MAARSGFREARRDRVIDSLIQRWREAKQRTYQRQGIEELQGHPRLGLKHTAQRKFSND